MLATRRTLIAISAAASLAVPATAGAQNQDLRAPDRHDVTPPVVQDLRAPDRHDVSPSVVQDLRAPDRQAPVRTVQPSAPVTLSPSTGSQPSGSDGFQWGDATIGAAGMLGIVGIVAGGALTLHRRRDGLAMRSH